MDLNCVAEFKSHFNRSFFTVLWYFFFFFVVFDWFSIFFSPLYTNLIIMEYSLINLSTQFLNINLNISIFFFFVNLNSYFASPVFSSLKCNSCSLADWSVPFAILMETNSSKKENLVVKIQIPPLALSRPEKLVKHQVIQRIRIHERLEAIFFYAEFYCCCWLSADYKENL